MAGANCRRVAFRRRRSAKCASERASESDERLDHSSEPLDGRDGGAIPNSKLPTCRLHLGPLGTCTICVRIHSAKNNASLQPPAKLGRMSPSRSNSSRRFLPPRRSPVCLALSAVSDNYSQPDRPASSGTGLHTKSNLVLEPPSPSVAARQSDLVIGYKQAPQAPPRPAREGRPKESAPSARITGTCARKCMTAIVARRSRMRLPIDHPTRSISALARASAQPFTRLKPISRFHSICSNSLGPLRKQTPADLCRSFGMQMAVANWLKVNWSVHKLANDRRHSARRRT